MARKRWRQFSGKHSRFHRRHSRKGSKYGGKYRGRGILGKGYLYEHMASAAAPVAGAADPSQFVGAAYKAGQGRGTPSGGNPKDRMGNVMRCHICNSEQHLARDCPRRDVVRARADPLLRERFTPAAIGPEAGREPGQLLALGMALPPAEQPAEVQMLGMLMIAPS